MKYKLQSGNVGWCGNFILGCNDGPPGNARGEGLRKAREEAMGVHRSPPQPRKLVQRLETEICRCLRNGEKARVEGGAESWSWKPWVAPWVLVRPLAYSWLKWDSHGREESRNVMLFVRSGALDAVRRENCGRGWWKPSPDRKQLKPSSQNGGVLQRDVTRDLGEAAASRKIANKQNLLLYCCQMVGDK